MPKFECKSLRGFAARTSRPASLRVGKTSIGSYQGLRLRAPEGPGRHHRSFFLRRDDVHAVPRNVAAFVKHFLLAQAVAHRGVLNELGSPFENERRTENRERRTLNDQNHLYSFYSPRLEYRPLHRRFRDLDLVTVLAKGLSSAEGRFADTGCCALGYGFSFEFFFRLARLPRDGRDMT